MAEENPGRYGERKGSLRQQKRHFSYKDAVTFPKSKVACGAKFV